MWKRNDIGIDMINMQGLRPLSTHVYILMSAVFSSLSLLIYYIDVVTLKSLLFVYYLLLLILVLA